MRVLIEYALAHSDEIDAVLTLDAGGLKRNAIVASMLEKPVAFINKYRDPITRQVIPGKSMVIGDIKDMRVAAFDDMLQEGGTPRPWRRDRQIEGSEVNLLLRGTQRLLAQHMGEDQPAPRERNGRQGVHAGDVAAPRQREVAPEHGRALAGGADR